MKNTYEERPSNELRWYLTGDMLRRRFLLLFAKFLNPSRIELLPHGFQSYAQLYRRLKHIKLASLQVQV